MGYRFTATCRDCGFDFMVDEGGGFAFHQLRCDRCGETKSIGFDEIDDLHLRYLKGLPRIVTDADISPDECLPELINVQPLSENDYHRAVEGVAGRCTCRGKYLFDAPPRCPRCRSTSIQEGDTVLCFD